MTFLYCNAQSRCAVLVLVPKLGRGRKERLADLLRAHFGGKMQRRLVAGRRPAIGVSARRKKHPNHVYVPCARRPMQGRKATGVFEVDAIRIFSKEALHPFHMPCCCGTQQRPGVKC